MSKLRMKKPQLDARDAAVRYISYIAGFVLSVLITVLAYVFVVQGLWPKEVLLYIVTALALTQLMVQLVFFLHLGRGGRWKLLTFFFAVIVAGILVIGTLWVMHNLNYNMMHMSPDEMNQYMKEHEGI